MGDYVVHAAGVGIFHEPEGKATRAWQDHRRGEVLTEEDLRHSDVDRLVELGAIRPVDDEAEDEEDDDAPYEAWTVAQLKDEIGRRNDAKDEGDELLSTTGVKADLVAVLEEDDSADDSGAGAVPEAAGPTVPESH